MWGTKSIKFHLKDINKHDQMDKVQIWMKYPNFQNSEKCFWLIKNIL